MLRTAATTVDRDTIPAIRGRSLAVHSVFTHAVNLAAGRELIGLVSAGRPISPHGIVVDLPTFEGLGLTAGSSGALIGETGEALAIGDRIRIDLASAPVWEPPGIAGKLVPAAVATLDGLLEPHPLGGGSHEVFGFGVGDALAARAAEFCAALLRARSGVLCHAAGGSARSLSIPDDDGALQLAPAARRLLGLGFGLTPSGDDWLVGFAFASAHVGGVLSPAVPAIRAAAEDGTTVDLSLSALRAALAGRAVEPLHNLLAALTGHGGSAVERELSELRAIGHTSGTDMAHGLLAAVLLSTKYEE